MSGPVQRQPLFWAVITAVAALFIFTMVIVASNRGDDRGDSTTVVQQPSPPDQPALLPVPVPSPAAPPATPASPAPPVVRERTIIIPDEKPAKQPAAPRAKDPAPAPVPSTPRVTEIKEFRSTGLPVEIRFEDRGWKAIEERAVTDAATELKSIGTTEDDAEVWVPTTAVEPYDQIFIAVLDEEGKYVVYRKP